MVGGHSVQLRLGGPCAARRGLFGRGWRLSGAGRFRSFPRAATAQGRESSGRPLREAVRQPSGGQGVHVGGVWRKVYKRGLAGFGKGGGVFEAPQGDGLGVNPSLCQGAHGIQCGQAVRPGGPARRRRRGP